jgi:hypothetical protein
MRPTASILVPGGAKKHAHEGRESKETMVLNVWALSQEQRSALFGEQGGAVTGIRDTGLDVVGVGETSNLIVVDGAGSGDQQIQPLEQNSGSPNSTGRARPSITILDPPANAGPTTLDSPVSAGPDPMTLIERFHAELGGTGHEEESADYAELKARLESEEKKEFAVKVSISSNLNERPVMINFFV